MGAFMTMALTMSVVMAGFEWYIVHTYRPEKWTGQDLAWPMRQLTKAMYGLGPFIERSPARSFVFSMGISVLLGLAWPVAGFVGFVGAVGSTLLMQPYYKARRMVAKHKQKRMYK